MRPDPEVMEQVMEVSDEELAALKAAVADHPAGSALTDVPLEEPDPQPSMADEAIQRIFDEQYVDQLLGNARQNYARAKVQHHLSFAGKVVDEHGKGLHPNTVRASVIESREMIDYLVALRAEIGPEGLPTRNLEVASAIDIPEPTGEVVAGGVVLG